MTNSIATDQANKRIAAAKIKAKFRADGVTIVAWAAEHGYKYHDVINVLAGVKKGIRGKAYEISVALGMAGATKEVNEVVAVSELAINPTTYATLATVLRAAEAVREQGAAGVAFNPDLLDLGESLNEVTLMGEAALITGALLMFATGQSADDVLAIFNQNH